jgi:hypothetical protein
MYNSKLYSPTMDAMAQEFQQQEHQLHNLWLTLVFGV